MQMYHVKGGEVWMLIFKSQDCHILPEVSHVHAGEQEIIILMSDFVDKIAMMALLGFPAI
jgi:hypothetical protein